MVHKLSPALIPLLIKKGGRINFSLFTMYFMKGASDNVQIIVPKHCGIAVDRHRIIRRLKAVIFDKIGNSLLGKSVLFVAQKKLLTASSAQVKDDCYKAFNRINSI